MSWNRDESRLQAQAASLPKATASARLISEVKGNVEPPAASCNAHLLCKSYVWKKLGKELKWSSRAFLFKKKRQRKKLRFYLSKKAGAFFLRIGLARTCALSFKKAELQLRFFLRIGLARTCVLSFKKAKKIKLTLFSSIWVWQKLTFFSEFSSAKTCKNDKALLYRSKNFAYATLFLRIEFGKNFAFFFESSLRSDARSPLQAQ